MSFCIPFLNFEKRRVPRVVSLSILAVVKNMSCLLLQIAKGKKVYRFTGKLLQ